MDTGEIIFVSLLAGGFLIPTALYRQWWLFRTFLIFFAVFGLVEWWAVSSTDLSVSQHFWVLNNDNPAGAKVVLGGMILGWGALIFHLGAKKKRRNT